MTVKRGGIVRRMAQHVHFVVNDMRLWRSQPIDDCLGRLPPVEGRWPAEPGLFAVCNPPYFHAYAVPLIRSIIEHAPGTPLHLHLYDPTQDEFSVLSDLQPKTPLTWTWERGGVERIRPELRSIYMGSVRFIRLYQAVEHTGRPILALDVDSIVRRPIRPLIPDEVDLGLILRRQPLDPGKRVYAGAVYAAPGGQSVLGEAAARIAVHMAAPTKKLDQRCLWMAYAAHRDRIRFWPIPTTVSDFTFSPDSAIWAAKGPRKRTARFAVAQG